MKNQIQDPTRCCTPHWTGWNEVQCSRTAKYEHEGKMYCKQHHPDTIKERKAARDAKWQEQSDRNRRFYGLVARKNLVLERALDWYRAKDTAGADEALTSLSDAIEDLIKAEEG